MATYRYHFCDLLTGVLLEELPLNCQSFSQTISGAGTLTGTLPLGELTPAARWRDATVPKRTLVVVLRDETPVWGGWLIKRRPVSGGNAAEITAETLEGWLGRQEIQTDLTFTAVDVFTIVRGIITYLAGFAGGDLRINTGSNVAGYTQTVTYLGKDSTKVADAISKLAEVGAGFEHTIGWQRTGNTYSPVMTMTSPGLSSGTDGILLEYPGSLVDYDYPEDGLAAVNVMTAVGGDTGGGIPLLHRVFDTAGELAAGYPMLPGQIQVKDETDYARLGDRAAYALNAALQDHVVPTAELRGDADPHFGDFPLGVPARLRASSPYHPVGAGGVPGLDVTRRVTGWTVTPGPPEKVSLALGLTTGKISRPKSQRTIGEYLADLDRRVRELASRT